MKRRRWISLVWVTTLSTSGTAGSKSSRDRTQWMALRYNNDLTNIGGCISPFNPSGTTSPENLTEQLVGSVAEIAGLRADSVSLAPGFCMIPWWTSTLYPLSQHVDWWTATFGHPAYHTGWAAYLDYALEGGSFLGQFIQATSLTAGGAMPMLSWRMQDRQFTGHPINGSLGYATLSQFWYEHRHDSEFMVQPFNASAPSPEHTATMDWANLRVAAYHQSMLLELLARHNNSILAGVELDYERDPAFFKADMPQNQRDAAMLAFISAVRQAVGVGRTIGLRVPPSEETLAAIGLSVDMLGFVLQTGSVDYITMGVGFFQFQPGASDFETLVQALRSRTARGQILFELTSMLRYGCAPPPQKQSFRDRVPPLALVTSAHLAFEAGADGLAAFNFAYYRSFQGSNDSGHEPPFSILASARNRSWTAAQPQLYFLSASGYEDSHASNTRMPIDLRACIHDACFLVLALAPPMQGWSEPGILRLNLVTSPWRHLAGFRACPMQNLTEATASLNVTMNGIRLHMQVLPYKPVGWSSWPDRSFATFQVPVMALRAGRNNITVRVPPAAGESSYTLMHSGAPGGDGKRWHFPFPYTASSWTGPRINGSTHPGLSLIDCERRCDLSTACKGLYYGPGPGDRTCYTLDTLVLSETSLTGASYEKTNNSSGLAARAGWRVTSAMSPRSAADLTLVYVDLSLPAMR